MSSNNTTHIQDTVRQTAVVFEKCYRYYDPHLLYKLLTFTVGEGKMNMPKSTGVNVIVKSLNQKNICIVSYSSIEPCEPSENTPGKFKMKNIESVKKNFDGTKEITYIPGGIRIPDIKCKIQAKLGVEYDDIILCDIEGKEVKDSITIKLSERPEKFKHPAFIFVQPDEGNPMCGTVTLIARIISKDGI